MNASDTLPILLDYQLTSELSAIQSVITTLRKVLALHHPETHWFKIELLLREAFVNAALHGNKGSFEKSVFCHITIDYHTILIKVRDEGCGFDWNSALHTLKLSTEVQNLDDESKTIVENGRGLEIFKLYADTFSYNQSGTEITLLIAVHGHESQKRELSSLHKEEHDQFERI